MSITGLGFDSVELIEVLFGENNATGVLATSETSIICNAPQGVAGASVNVTVVMTSGSLTAPGQFSYEAPPNADLEITWRSTTGAISTGVLTVELHNETPITSENFRDLAEQGFYDDTLFHRIRFREKIEGGDFENGNGSGGHAAEFHGIGDESNSSTWRIPDEASTSPNHQPGALAMHLPSGADSAGSVFYIACPDSSLSNRDGVNTVFGQSVGGTIDGEDVGFEALLDALHRVATGSGDVPSQPVRLVEVRLSGGSITPPDGEGGEGEGPAPTINQVSPIFGPPHGGHQVVITGSGFAINPDVPPVVRFGGENASNVIVTSDGTLFCMTPPGPTSTIVDVEVLTQAGTGTSSVGYNYLAGPVLMFDLSWTDLFGEAHTGQLATELFDAAAPIHVENLLLHANNGMYDQVPFHRIIDGFMIQGGDFENGDGTGGYAAAYYGFGDPNNQTTWTVPDEADNGLIHIPGVLAMAKTGAPNSGGSQFFYVDRTSYPSHLDGIHTVFGRAAFGLYDDVEVSGLDVVDYISQVEVGASDVPVHPVMIGYADELGDSNEGASFGGPQGSGRLWNFSAIHAATLKEGALARGKGPDKWSGTRGVFSFDGSQGDRLHVLVRALELDVEPAPPLVIGERAGPLSLVAGEGVALSGERSFEVELKQDDRVLVFVPRAPAQWVKAWIEPDADQEE